MFQRTSMLNQKFLMFDQDVALASFLIFILGFVLVIPSWDSLWIRNSLLLQ
ncbi:hypothetical protein [Acinetobacter baumannii]|uniref:hypothetical protein n=1 Tax=Acinetobacter baumannii TaxID=470 RepID=UPI001D18646F|nr:hypothetical protein [Acinetobacter baumannii]